MDIISQEEERTHLLQWLGEGSLPVMRGLQLADKLQAELNGPNMEAPKTCFTQEIFERLLEIVHTLNDGIQKLSYPALLVPQDNAPLQQPTHTHHLKLGHSSPGIVKYPRKRCLSKFILKMQEVNEAGSDDNFTWRKYGQKTILGKRYPRSYYRCVHKGDLNCPALKRVQQCDGNASRFDITYIGKHTCEGICEGHQHTQNHVLSPLLSPLHSNSYTSSASTHELIAGTDGEPSLKMCEIELREEVSRLTMFSLLENEMLLSPQVHISLQENAEDYNVPQAKEQHEESHNFSPTWDFDLFPSFVDQL